MTYLFGGTSDKISHYHYHTIIDLESQIGCHQTTQLNLLFVKWLLYYQFTISFYNTNCHHLKSWGDLHYLLKLLYLTT